MKKQIIILISLVISTLTQAQETGNYLHFNAGTGQHNLSYSLQDGTQAVQSGYSANIAFSHFFTSSIGLQTGIGIQTFSALSTLNLIESTPAIDSDGDIYVFKSDFKNWQENQQVIFFEVPLTGQFKHKFNDKIGLLVTAGAKISIPVNATYKTTGGEIVTSGYYPQYNIELTDMPQHGFTTITQSHTGKYSLNPAYMAIAELGGTYKISERIDFYAGAYFNYGLNNLLKPDTKMLYLVDGTYNGVLGTYQTTGVKPFSIGIKLGLYLKLGKK
jgi:OmpA-OmpF porin, OOP family